MSEPNWKNRTLFHGDNLAFMRAMNSETIDLIATDPPFNKGKDFHATPAALKASGSSASFQDRWSWKDDVQGEWVDELQNDNPQTYEIIISSRKSYGDDMGAFLCYMAVRLLAMHRLLKPTGSLYLHCDPTASHYLKMLLDGIFGKGNFRNEIVWHYSGWNKRLKSHIERRHDTILFYGKSNKSSINYPTRPWESKAEYITARRQKVHIDDGGREYVLSDGGGGKRVKRYIDEAMKYGVPLDNVWDIDKINNSDTRERMGYPTQKPLALYERMIEISSNPGEIVLDPFCGCATTVIAAERLDRQWVGCDIWDGAGDMIVKRLDKERMAVEGVNIVEEGRQGYLEWKDKVTIVNCTPERTDSGETAVPYLKPTVKRVSAEPPGPRMSREEMVNVLVEENGLVCQGCGWKVHDKRHLELDHNTPRSSGGINHISNRILLCGPCNRLKSDTLTLKGLQKKNKQLGYLVDGA